MQEFGFSVWLLNKAFAGLGKLVTMGSSNGIQDELVVVGIGAILNIIQHVGI